MIEEHSFGSRLFDVLNHILLFVFGFLCLAPLVHVFAVSLSNSAASMGGYVTFWPVGFTTKNYQEIFSAPPVYSSFIVSVERTVLGTALNMLLTVITAYPLSKSAKEFKGRDIFMWIVLFAMLFSGGLIPWFLTIRKLGLINKIWALILPGALPIWNVILMMNFFREIPKELEEAAIIDGATHWQILYHVYLPLSLPSLATLTLFAAVGHWNAWFDGMILMTDNLKYPLQTFLRTVVIDVNLQVLNLNPEELLELSNRSARAATIFVTTIPILILYPFLQRYFISGIKLGAVKG
ncbi:MAG: carbohydrate ABC transporter permease [Anaerolineae bacterium]